MEYQKFSPFNLKKQRELQNKYRGVLWIADCKQEEFVTTGIQGTGPYGRMRALQNEIKQIKYELDLIKQGIRPASRRKALLEEINEKRKIIRSIKKNLKKEKRKTPIE